MSDMADMALQYAFDTECQLDDYVSGDMSPEEAYDNGFLNEAGVEADNIQHGWDRASVGSLEQVENDLSHAIKDFDLATRPVLNAEAEATRPILNAEAVANLVKDCPTCNYCRQSMSKRDGRYGLFYYCSNRCPGQKTVSDSYWQSIKGEHTHD